MWKFTSDAWVEDGLVFFEIADRRRFSSYQYGFTSSKEAAAA